MSNPSAACLTNPLPTFISHDELRWSSFCNLAEDMLGHDLDGDQETDGYSIEDALAAFDDGASVVEYVLDVQARKAGA